MFEVDTDENIIRVSLLILSTLLYFQISALVFLCVKGQILKILVQVYEAFNLLVPHKTPRTLRLKGTYHLCTFPYLERNRVKQFLWYSPVEQASWTAVPRWDTSVISFKLQCLKLFIINKQCLQDPLNLLFIYISSGLFPGLTYCLKISHCRTE